MHADLFNCEHVYPQPTSLACMAYTDSCSPLFQKKMQKRNAQTRNRTGGPTMATLDFTTKPFALFAGKVTLFQKTILLFSRDIHMLCT